MRACDNRVSGVVCGDGAGRVLLIERAKPPAGFAPPAGHVDGHGGFDAAARTEVWEETGLTVVGLRPLLRRWRPGVCGSRELPGPSGWGHEWAVYAAEVAGAPVVTDETRSVAWFGPADVQVLADRTVAFAAGVVPAEDFAAAPGLEPVWLLWLADPAVGVIRVSAADLALVEALVADPHSGVSR